MSPALASAVVTARRVGIVLALVVIIARPGFGRTEASTEQSDLEVLVAVDRTRSMAALDHDGHEPRIVGATADLTELAEELPGARFAVLAFGADARLVLPFTSDTSAFDAALETFDLEGPQDGRGSRADRPVPELGQVLERARDQRPDRRRVVVYVGDGEDTAPDEADRSFDDLRSLVDGGVVLGYGTEKGAVMPVADDYSIDDGYVRDSRTFDNAVSHADLKNLQGIADELDVPFVHRSAAGARSIRSVARSFDAAYGGIAGGDGQPAKHDLTWLAGLVLLGLVLVELRAGWQALWAARRALQPTSPREPTRGGRP
ncbi:MAG TPA: vWA domain-containing protein [Nocardioides sp.]|nr:vWA domain-containing protein [Nocardioides sp.]